MPRIVLALLATGLVFLSACDGNGGNDPTPTSSVSGTTPVASTTSPDAPADTPEDRPVPDATAPPDFEGGRDPVEGGSSAGRTVNLVDVRTGRHDEGFDRVTFEFSNGIPAYSVQYVEPSIKEDPSDLPVDIEGSAFLQVTFTGASAFDLSGGREVNTCCRSEINTGYPALADLQPAGDFEGVLIYVLGLTEEVDFSVGELSGLPAIYIDVRHP